MCACSLGIGLETETLWQEAGLEEHTMTRQDELGGRLRVLWLSNKVLSSRDSGGTGTWLDAMAQGLIESGAVALGNITHGDVSRVTRQDTACIQQWLVPYKAKSWRWNELPTERTVMEIIQVVEEFKPRLVHVWGTEGYWGILTARKLISLPALLETQGVKGAIARVFHGGLSFREQLACIGLKEILRGSTIFQGRKQFAQWGLIEQEMISGHQFITFQSKWLEAQIRAVNSTGTTFHNDFALRDVFYTCEPWQRSTSISIVCSSAYPASFKGLHVAVRATAILKRRFPDVELRIIGAQQTQGIRRDGYVNWLNHEAKRLGIDTNLRWLGPLSAPEMISELQRCAAFVLPSFIEGYSLALAEAQMLGVPSVVSFAGGTPSLARDEDSALSFSPGDEVMCAYQLERLLTDRVLAERISRRAREIAVVRNDRNRIVRRQIEIYRQVLQEDN